VTSQPAQAYSLRLVNDAYVGYAVKVRRSSDSTEQDIGFSGTALDTAALTTFVGAGDGFVSKWYDQSGNNRHLDQATLASQPKLVSAGAVLTSGGKPAVVFDGVDDHLFNTAPVLYAGGAATLAAVVNAAQPLSQLRWWAESNSASSADQYGLLEPDGAATGRKPWGFPVISGAVTDSGILPQPSIPLWNGVVHQASSVDTGTTISQWVDGASDMAAAPYTRPASTKNRFAIGGVLRSGSLAPLPMTLSEALFWPGALSTGDRQLAEASQKAFYTTP
jgi:hypothetical protein